LIRKIQINDIQAVVAIYNYYISNTIVSFEEQPISAKEMRLRINKVTSAGFPWLVAEEHGKIIGYAYSYLWNDRSAYKKSAEVTVYLSHLHTSKGWGTKFYDALFVALKKIPIHIVIGGIAIPNPASIALHEKFGMVKVAHFKKIGFKFNKWIDVGYWQKELNA